MHELSIAQSMLGIVLQEAARHGAEKVQKVVVRVGAYSGVVPHSLRFCFDLIKKDTPAAEAELEVNQAPITATCAACGQQSLLDEPTIICPLCQADQLSLEGGRELFVEYIEAQ